jgi:hypothetical protein
MARMLVVLLALLPLPALAADEQRIAFLESEVRNLQRQVMAMSRQLDEIRTRPDRPASQAPAAAVAPAPASDQWIDAARWRQVRPGMNELDVIGLLGPPSSMRTEGEARVLLYALEIGSSGFLGGSVVLHDRSVAEVRPPTLQ